MATPSANGGQPSWSVQALAEVCRRLRDVVPSPECPVHYSAFSSPAYTDIPVFRGFQDDAIRWVQLIDALAAHHTWPDHVKWPFTVERLRDAARAWHLYDGHTHSTWASWSGALIAAFGNFSGTRDARYMEMRNRHQGHGEDIKVYIHEKLRLLVDCGLPWMSPAARQYVIDGLADPVQAAILAVQPSDLSLQDFILLAVELQQSAALQAQESHLQASEQTLSESRGPGPDSSNGVEIPEQQSAEWSDISLNNREGPSDAATIVTEDHVSPPPSFSYCALKYRQKRTEANEPQLAKVRVDRKVLPEHHADTCTQIDILNTRSSAANSSARFLPASKCPPEQRPDVLTSTSIPLSKPSEEGSYHFVDITSTETPIQDSVRPGRLLEHFNSKEATERHILFTPACDMNFQNKHYFLTGNEKKIQTEKTIQSETPSNSSTSVSEVFVQGQAIVSAPSDEVKSKEMPAEEIDQVPSTEQIDDDSLVQNEDALVTDKDVPAAVIEDGNNHSNSSDDSDLLQFECKDSVTRPLGVQEEKGREDLNRAARSLHREETYDGFFSRPYVDLRARVTGPPKQFAGAPLCSVAECEGAKNRQREAARTAGGQSPAKPKRTTADWKRRRKKKQGSRTGRLNMASY